LAEPDPVAIGVKPAVSILAAILIVDAVPIADVQSFARAIGPDRVLNEAGEDSWKRAVELAGVDTFAQDRQH
jgi:hypothetical protein